MPKVNVLLVTYNHEPFIRQAIESIALQRLDGELEIIVADDKSTDATLAIIRTFQITNPKLRFRFLKTLRNLGITRNYERGFAACTAEYVAVLEGDDYWTDPYKLQKHIDFLDTHRECVSCSSNYIVFEEATKCFTPRVLPRDGWEYLTSRSLISDNLIGNFSTCTYRTSALRLLPPSLFTVKAYDWALHITLGQFGLIGFLREPMSVYRVHAKGSWSLLTRQQRLADQLALLPLYDRITRGTFHDEFTRLGQQLIDAGAESTSSLRAHVVKRHVMISILSFALKLFPPLVITIAKALIPPFLVSRVKNIIRR
jgi:glycosyltransferase involved in cell wall biosynthesis